MATASDSSYEDEKELRVIVNNPRTDGGDEINIVISKPPPEEGGGKE